MRLFFPFLEREKKVFLVVSLFFFLFFFPERALLRQPYRRVATVGELTTAAGRCGRSSYAPVAFIRVFFSFIIIIAIVVVVVTAAVVGGTMIVSRKRGEEKNGGKKNSTFLVACALTSPWTKSKRISRSGRTQHKPNQFNSPPSTEPRFTFNLN